jgi:hypothetical protein
MYVPMGFDSDPRTPIPSLVDPPERTVSRQRNGSDAGHCRDPLDRPFVKSFHRAAAYRSETDSRGK